MATKQVRKPGRPAKKTRRTFAAGGVVRLAQGEKVPDAEEAMRQMGANQYGGAGPGPAPVQRTLADAVGGAVTSAVQGGRDAMGAAADYAQRALSAPAGRSGSGSSIGAANMQRGEAAPSGPGYRGPRAPVETYTGPVAEFLAGSSAPAPGVASRSSQGVPSRAMAVADAANRAPEMGRELRDRGLTAAGGALAAMVPAAVAGADTGYDYSSKAGTRGAAPAAGAVPAAPPQQRSAPEFGWETSPESAAQYKRQLEAAGGRVLTNKDGSFGGYSMPSDQPVSAADLARQVRAAGGGNPDAFSPDAVAEARRSAQQFQTRQGQQGGGQGMADNALLQKWYSMPEKERGRMPASVENAKYRGADDTETAFNVARARIMQTPMDPGRQAQALANLDKTRADMLNQSQQTRQTGEYQQGQLGNERERTGVFRQQTEQTGQNQQAQMAHQQRMAQLALDQGVAEGALLPDEEYQKERALDDAYNTAYEQRRTIRERARRILMGRMMKGETLQDVIANPGTDDERAMLSTIINPSVAMRPQQYAGGGMVSPQPPVYGGAPDAQRADPLINAYRIYTTQSKAMGAPTVPFAEFSSLYAGAAQGPMQPSVGMAGGGAVPAAGKLVIDTNPNARVDSIPAMIDGEHPAALDSGEFVFPTDVTSYYGTKMLSGMIEKARQGANGSKPSGRSAEAV